MARRCLSQHRESAIKNIDGGFAWRPELGTLATHSYSSTPSKSSLLGFPFFTVIVAIFHRIHLILHFTGLRKCRCLARRPPSVNTWAANSLLERPQRDQILLPHRRSCGACAGTEFEDLQSIPQCALWALAFLCRALITSRAWSIFPLKVLA